MKTSVIVEQPVISIDYGVCHDCNQECQFGIQLYHKDLFNAEIGREWSWSMVDKCPNAQKRWVSTLTLIYRDNHGVLLRYNDNEPCSHEEPELIWVELSMSESKEK